MGVTLQRTGHSRGIKPRGVGDSRENYKVPQLNNQVGHEGGAAQVPEDRKKKKRQTTRAGAENERDGQGANCRL